MRGFEAGARGPWSCRIQRVMQTARRTEGPATVADSSCGPCLLGSHLICPAPWEWMGPRLASNQRLRTNGWLPEVRGQGTEKRRARCSRHVAPFSVWLLTTRTHTPTDVAVNDPDARPRTPESAVHFMSRSPRALAGSSSGGSSPPSRGRATPADAERVSCKPGFPLTP